MIRKTYWRRRGGALFGALCLVLYAGLWLHGLWYCFGG